MPVLNMKATVRYAGDDLFVGFSPGGHAHVIETDSRRNSAVTPVEMLLTALGACTGADVVSVLRKKREKVTGYHLELSGDRREEYPRKFEEIRVHHVVRAEVRGDSVEVSLVESLFGEVAHQVLVALGDLCFGVLDRHVCCAPSFGEPAAGTSQEAATAATA